MATPALRVSGCAAIAVAGAGLVALGLLGVGGASPTAVGPITRVSDHRAVGVAFSGGGLSAMADAQCFLAALDNITEGRFNSSAAGSSRVFIASVSGGSLGYALYTNAKVVVPELHPNWTVEELVSWPGKDVRVPAGDSVPFNVLDILLMALPSVLTEDADLAERCVTGNLSACTVLRRRCSAGEEEGVAVRPMADSLDTSKLHESLAKLNESLPSLATETKVCAIVLRLVDCFLEDSLWPCVVEALGAVYGRGGRRLEAGNRPWWVQFAVMDASKAPYGAGPLPEARLTDHVAPLVLEAMPGRRDILVRSPTFEPSGLGSFDGSNETKSGRFRSHAVDLFTAIAYSSHMVNSNTLFLDSDTNSDEGAQTCPLAGFAANESHWACARAAVVRNAYNLRSAVLGRWTPLDAQGGRRDGPQRRGALGTDGGIVETTGLITLARAGLRNMILFYESAFSFADWPQVGFLFGVPCCGANLCRNNYQALGARNLQIFHERHWVELRDGLLHQGGNGSVVLRNVEVVDNAWLGVKAYTVAQLVVLSNNKMDAFAHYLRHWGSISAALGPRVEGDWTTFQAKERAPFASGWPALSGMVTPFNATVKCLLAQFKVQLAKRALLGVLDQALDP